MQCHVVDHAILKTDLTVLRDKTTPNHLFRIHMNRISEIMAIELLKASPLDSFNIETPLESTTGYRLKERYVLVPVLRAGLGLLEGFLKYLPDATVSHIGVFRDEQTHQPKFYYSNIPSQLEQANCIILDPMLATGGSAAFVANCLKEKGAKNLTLVSVVSAPEGIALMNTQHPDIAIYTGTIDRQLNQTKYILPGLGDAGDRLFGT
jgi:uracil phosphoribosyltransferase